MATKIDDDSYEIGYRDGESSGYADWHAALDAVLPEDLPPSQVAAEMERLQDELAAVRKLVDEAVTTCGLGSAVAAHFGRDDLP